MADVVRFKLSVFHGVQPHGAAVIKLNGRTFYVPSDKIELKNGFVYIDAWHWRKAVERQDQKVVKIQLKRPDWW